MISSGRLPVHRLFVVTFWAVKVIQGFLTLWRVSNSNPCIVQGSTVESGAGKKQYRL